MARIALTNNSGQWFDNNKAQVFEEKTRWDGSNHISLATGSQWIHERIYLTASGKFILGTSSAYQGVRNHYDLVSEAFATEWFLKQGFTDNEMPEILIKHTSNYEV